MHVCMYACMHACMYVCMYVHTHSHTHTQVMALGKEVAQLQRKLLQAETEGEAGAKMQAAELESVKEKSKVYMKKAVDQQKVLQARLREVEEQLELQRGASERARMDAMFSTTKAQASIGC